MTTLERPLPPLPDAPGSASRLRRLRPDTLPKLAAYVVLGLMAIAALMPLYWMFTTSLKGQASYMAQPPEMFPADPTFSNFQQLFANPNMIRWIFNSLFVALSVTGLNLVFATLAGYAFAKMTFPGRRWMFWVYLATMMVPFQVTIFALFQLIATIGWVNTYWALIIPSMALPYNVFLMRQFMQSLPTEILDAGRIDGCTEVQLVRRVVVPMSTNGMAVVGIFTFITTWNNCLWPLVVLNTEEMRTLPIALSTFQSTNETDYGLLMAGGVLMAIPMFMIFFAFQRYFLRGVTFGGLKG
ncbi:MAG: carbohydrate ABC transporter permease [Chloroflexota bacterium]